MSATPLTDTVEVVERSIFHSIRQEVIDKGYFPDIAALIEDNIVALNQGTKEFTIANNRTSYYTVGRKFNVLLSTGNNGEYTVVSSAFSTPNTIVTVSENIPSAVVDGKLSIYQYYDDDAGVASFKSAIDTIINIKGFAIEVFGVSAPAAKYQKKVPRIVVMKYQFLPGDLGGAPDKIYTPNNGDILNPDTYTARIQPPQTVNYNFDIRLVSQTANQSRILHGLLALSVPKRGYINMYNDPSKKIFVLQYSYRSIPDHEGSIEEDIYMYSAQDIFESEDTIVSTNVAPITEITTEYKEGDPDNNKDMGTVIITP